MNKRFKNKNPYLKTGMAKRARMNAARRNNRAMFKHVIDKIGGK